MDRGGVGAIPRISAMAAAFEEEARRLARRCLERALRRETGSAAERGSENRNKGLTPCEGFSGAGSKESRERR